MWEKFTLSARQAVCFAQEEARNGERTEVDATDLLLGALRVDGGAAARLLEREGVSPVEFCAAIQASRRHLWTIPRRPSRDNMRLSSNGKAVIDGALTESRGLGHSHIGTGHFLLGAVRSPDRVGAVLLAARGTNTDRLRAAFAALCASGEEGEEIPPEENPPTVT